MRLAYLYICRFRNFKNIGFNLTNDFLVQYDGEKKTFSIRENESRLPKRFWGENIQDLFMVVGNNGAGKTGLMQFVIRLFTDMAEGRASSAHTSEECGFAVFEEDGKFCSYILGGFEPTCNIPPVICGYKGMERTKLIYLTNVLSPEDSRRSRYPSYGRYSFFYDCSISALFHADNRNDVYTEYNPLEETQLDTYFYYEQYKQIKFVFDRNQAEILRDMKHKGFCVPVPEKLHIGVICEDLLDRLAPGIRKLPWKTSLEKFTFDYELLWPKTFRNQQMQEMENVVADYFPYILARCTVRSLFSSFFRWMSQECREKMLEWTAEREAGEREGKAFFKDMVEWICSTIIQSGETVILNEDYRSKAYRLCELKKCYLDYLDFIFDENISGHFQFTEPEKWLTWDYRVHYCSVDTSDDWFMDFLKKYRYVCNPDYFLNFDWGLSSGEKNLLSLFSSLYYVFDRDYTNTAYGDYKIYNQWKRGGEKGTAECDSLILMLDEADLTYHPEWQREFIRVFTEFLTRIYSPVCCKNIQLLISTHSPILLSDMPGGNVIYLEYDRSKKKFNTKPPVPNKTFGQNIYLLFKYSFFLKGGTIGAFAEQKLTGLADDLKSLEDQVQSGSYDIRMLEQELKELWMLADLVGEPVIRGKLKSSVQQTVKRIQLSAQKEQISRLSNDELGKQIERLQREQERRRDDKNNRRHDTGQQ